MQDRLPGITPHGSFRRGLFLDCGRTRRPVGETFYPVRITLSGKNNAGEMMALVFHGVYSRSAFHRVYSRDAFHRVPGARVAPKPPTVPPEGRLPRRPIQPMEGRTPRQLTAWTDSGLPVGGHPTRQSSGPGETEAIGRVGTSPTNDSHGSDARPKVYLFSPGRAQRRSISLK